MAAAAGTASRMPVNPNSPPPRHQGEQHPHRMQADAFADQFGRQEIPLEDLPEREDGDDQRDRQPFGKLRQRQAQAGDQPDGRAEIGDERDQPGAHAHQQAEVEPNHGQSDGVNGAQYQADQRLAAQESGQAVVDLAHLFANGVGGAAGQQAVEVGDDPIPVAQQVERHHRHDHRQRQDLQKGRATADHSLHDLADPPGDVPGEIAAEFLKLLELTVGEAGAQLRDQRVGERAKPVQIARQAADQIGDLGAENGNQNDDHRHQHRQERADDQCRGDSPSGIFSPPGGRPADRADNRRSCRPRTETTRSEAGRQAARRRE